MKLISIFDYLNEIKESPLDNDLPVSSFKFMTNKFIVGYEFEFLYNKGIAINHNKIVDAAKKAIPNDLHTFISKHQYELIKPLLITEFIDKVSLPSINMLTDMMKTHKTFYSAVFEHAAKDFNVLTPKELSYELVDDIISTLSEQEHNIFKLHFLMQNFFLINASLIQKYKNVYNILEEYNLLEQLVVSSEFNYHNVIVSDLNELCSKITTDIKVVDDSSVMDVDTRYIQAEIVTPPLELSKSLELLDIISHYISTHGITNTTCGFHVNISFSDKSRFSKMDWLKLAIFLNDPILLNAFNRTGNTFAASIYNLLLDWLPKNLKTIISNISANKPSVSDINMFRSIINVKHSDKYYTFRVNQTLNYVEYRMMGNTDYNKQINKIKNVMHRIMNSMLIASNPQSYKKDYIKKLLKYSKLKDKINKQLDAYLDKTKPINSSFDIPREARDIISTYTSDSINAVEFIKYLGA